MRAKIIDFSSQTSEGFAETTESFRPMWNSETLKLPLTEIYSAHELISNQSFLKDRGEMKFESNAWNRVSLELINPKWRVAM